MGNRVRVEAELFDFAACTAVVGGICSVGKEKFRFALRRVFLNGNKNGGTKKDAVVARLGSYVRAFVHAEAPAEFCRNDDSATFADSSRFQSSLLLQNI